jgi:hypothetical protein
MAQEQVVAVLFKNDVVSRAAGKERRIRWSLAAVLFKGQ